MRMEVQMGFWAAIEPPTGLRLMSRETNYDCLIAFTRFMGAK